MTSREEIRRSQLDALRALVRQLVPSNRFYAPKLAEAGIDPDTVTLNSFSDLMPFTTRAEWVTDQLANPPYGTNLTFELAAYNRLCRTSGSTGDPMNWLDTKASWAAMLKVWTKVLNTSGVAENDTVFCAFSFGPFLGFWTAYEAAHQMGCLTIPGGGLSSGARLDLILSSQATVLLCTPTYAIHLAQEASRNGIDLSDARIKTIIVAGEPGGSIPTTRSLITNLWNGAKVFDHHGMTEVGPVSYPCPDRQDVLHVDESAFYAEVIDPDTNNLATEGELVLTTLQRVGSPLLRYRTGDRVQSKTGGCSCGHHDMRLLGGILGRADDMVIIRGVNIFPTAVERIIREFPEVVEYRVEVHEDHAMKQLRVQAEFNPSITNPDHVRLKLEKQLQSRISLRIPVEIVPTDSLPRFELKAKRWIQIT